MTRLIPEHFRDDGRAKHPYATQAEAAEKAQLQQAGSGSKRRPYHAYMCGFCGCWHIGRKPPPGKRSRSRRSP